MKRLFAAVVAVGALTVGALPVGAGNFAGPQNPNAVCHYDSECWTDNAAFVWYENLGSGPVGTMMYFHGVKATLYDSYDTTDLTVTKDTGNFVTTDVFYYFRDDLAPGDWGFTFCKYFNSDPYECDHFVIVFNGPKMGFAGFGTDTPEHRDALKTIACHETGHAVGLEHGADAYPLEPNSAQELRCMRTPAVLDDPLVGTHNVAQIRWHYS